MKKVYLDNNLTKKINSIIEQDATTKYQYIEFQVTNMIFPEMKDDKDYCSVMGISCSNRSSILILIPDTHPKLNNAKNKYDGLELLESYTLHIESTYGNLTRYYVVDDTEILDNSEKEYLSFVFKPFAKRILSVTKVQNSNNGYQKLVIAFYDKTKMIMPRFEYNTMYRGMELNVAYTLEELGISESDYKTKKITLTEFWNGFEPRAIHCDTKEKADELLKAFDNLGKKWNSDKSYLSDNCYFEYARKTCYSNQNGYCDYDFYKKMGYNIYEFEEVDLNK